MMIMPLDLACIKQQHLLEVGLTLGVSDKTIRIWVGTSSAMAANLVSSKVGNTDVTSSLMMESTKRWHLPGLG